ncbi:transposase [Rhizobium dioscoreae]|uniref:Transposase n=1 Tax=Rhizobium dioscoreae TaxID=2653122 RepID=A0ABQ0ZCP1_9HYPH|nr:MULTISPECIES: transposase [Rhizobium]GES53157.1 hypothetical protein RsS93_57710 [Rhizobium dioscoreae]
MSDTVNQTRAFELLTATPIATRRKPRDWPHDEKARLVAATLEPGANVSAIARGAGLDPSQLYDWRRKAIASGSIAPLSKSVDTQVRFAQVEAVAGSAVEIVIGDAVVRVGGDLATERLVKILRAVRQA